MTQLEPQRPLTRSSDAELTARAVDGDQPAFEELYRRHSQHAWGVAQAVTRDPHDAADAVADAFTRILAAVQQGRYDPDAPFRPYLVVATRNAAIDVLRRRETAQVVDLTAPAGAEGLEPSARGRAGEEAIENLDRTMVNDAFDSLPERWRTVLWLTEVEGLPPREAAAHLGISANGAAQLAVRARAALRARYVQAHLQPGDDLDAPCRRVVEHLGGYVTGGLAPREVALVDQHLAGCAACRERVEELREDRPRLGHLALPLPALLLDATTDRWRQWLATEASARRASGLWRAAAGATAGVLALGLVSLPFVDRRSGGGEDRARAGGTAVDEVAAPDLAVDGVEVAGAVVERAPSGAARGVASSPAGGSDTDPEGRAAAGAVAPDAAAPAVVTPAAPPPPAPPVEDAGPAPLVALGVGAQVGGAITSASLAIGGECEGITIGTADDCGQAPPGDDGVTVTSGGSLLPAVEVTLP
jgi:RNA polymerase sigma factor (sigma-70 family)